MNGLLARVLVGMTIATCPAAIATALGDGQPASRPAAGLLTARVEASSGAPRLLLNAVPIRARMFYGWQAPAWQALAEEPKLVSFEFTPLEDEPATATMHFRFGQTAGDIFLADIRVTDLDANTDIVPPCRFPKGMDSFFADWVIWPPGEQNTVATVTVDNPPSSRPAKDANVGPGPSPALHVKLRAPAAGPWPDFHIYHKPNLSLNKAHRYRVSVLAWASAARNISVAFYRPGKTFTLLGGPPGIFSSQIRLARDAGVNIVSTEMACPFPAPGEAADWQSADAVVRGVLRAHPKALVLPRIGISVPPWWAKAHSGDVMRWEDGRADSFVPASPQFRKDAAEHLEALVTHLEEAFGEHIIGYHPCGQNTGEWFYLNTWERPLSGYAPADLAAWRIWLKDRYGSDAELQRAWGDANASLLAAPVPSAQARHAAPTGVLREGPSQQPLVDFARFQQDAMADCVCTLAHAVRTGSRGRKLVLFFYGYGFEFGAVHTGPAVSGHYALRRVLQCPDIDVLCSPISYFDRGLGQSAPAMSAAESVALASKMWLCEDDTATYLSSGQAPGHTERVGTLEGTNAMLVRNVGQESLRNFATWWMDLGGTGWFNDPGMWAEMSRLGGLDEAMLARPTPFRPEVAAVLDEQSMLFVAAGGNLVTSPCVYEARRGLGRMGAPYGQYLLDDVLAGKVHAKLYVLLNAWSLAGEQRGRLSRAMGEASRIWCYAPGYLDEQGQPSLQAMKELTGFAMKKVAPAQALATPTPVGRAMGLQQPVGVPRKVEPLFAAADATPDETLATYADGSAAIALRPTGKGWSLFVGAPGLSAELLRILAAKAQVHLYARTDCNVYANGPFLVLHASADGPVEIDTGTPGPVVDFLTGGTLGQGPRVTIPAKTGQTWVLKH